MENKNNIRGEEKSGKNLEKREKEREE